MREITIKLNFAPYCFTLCVQILLHSHINYFHFDSAFIERLSDHFRAIRGNTILEDTIIQMISHHLAQKNPFTKFTFLVER